MLDKSNLAQSTLGMYPLQYLLFDLRTDKWCGSGSRSYGSRGGVSTSTFSHGTDLRSPTSPVTPQKDISLEEMLGSSTIPKLDKTARWPGGTAVVGVGGSMAYPEEEEADEVYLASYDDAKEKEQKKGEPSGYNRHYLTVDDLSANDGIETV